MSAPAEPLRLLLLADTPDWAPLLGERLRALGPAFSLSIVTTWEGAATLFAAEPRGLLLATPACLPLGTPCPWPVILLLQQEPAQAPVGVVDWLAAEQLSEDSLRRCLRYARERLGLQATLQLLAEQDPLTGIANRQGFQTLLAARLSEFDGRGLVLGHLDLDNFRHVNDSLGHQGGDRLILQVVNRLRGFMENGDSLARLGSDEFALLLDTRRDPQRAERVAERIVECLGEPYWIDGESLLLGCSLGLAHARADEGADPLMWHAHIAMQQAKSRQGCTFHVFDERINRGVRSLADLEAELRRALRRDELELHYQPRLCLDSGRIVGLEALVRWRHGERGLLTPSEFVPLAEESGLIVPLGYWLQTMQALGQLGVRFSLDDFGTGFSSFVHLNSLPITLLKIDRSFVGGMDQRAENFQLVRAMINLAHNLNLEVVAEGVETLRQQEQLRDFGCDQVQGYWISPPLPLAELARFLGIGERSAHRGQPLGN
nr:EAL domain-containing protein [Pseudomonas aeruginosa]